MLGDVGLAGIESCDEVAHAQFALVEQCPDQRQSSRITQHAEPLGCRLEQIGGEDVGHEEELYSYTTMNATTRIGGAARRQAGATGRTLWTADQLRAFFDHAADSRYLPAWIFLATSGCRRGEGLGLKWSDVDLDVGTAVISRQVTVVDHEVIVKDVPKTKLGHLIRLDGGTVAMLRRLRSEQAEEKLRLGPGYIDEGFVFCRWDGQPYHPERFSREFERNREYFDRDNPNDHLPPITLHGLRHTWATLALTAGIDIKVVSERLNHSSTTITREIYTHVTPPMQSDAAERVAGLIRGDLGR